MSSDEIGTPDFDALGRETLWSADEWRSAWGRLADQEQRSDLWPTVVSLGADGSRPSSVAAAFLPAMHSVTKKEPR